MRATRPVEELDRECGYCSICKLRPLEERWPADFREWVANLIRLHLWRKAGYALDREPLDFGDWQALALITRFYEVKDLECLIQRPPI